MTLIMEKRNVIGKVAASAVATNGNRRPLATVPSVDEHEGCDCPNRQEEGAPSHYVDHYCGHKREYPHR